MTSFLLILGNRQGLAWVLSNNRMAFSRQRATDARRLTVGDELLLYMTRGCFHNPGRDRGRVMGSATVASTVSEAHPPVELASRVFPLVCEIKVKSLAPLGAGVVIADRLDELTVFPDPASWSAWLRRPLLELPTADARLLGHELRALAGPPESALNGYRHAAARRGNSRSR